MSRSYKKNPVIKDTLYAKEGKKRANHAVRRNALEQASKGSSYKKAFESWDISDYSFRQTEEAFRKDWERENGPADKNPKKYKRDLFEWKKTYLSK